MRLSFPNAEHAAVAVVEGELSLGAAAANDVAVAGVGMAAHHARLSCDARGVWLHVLAGAPAVHVNARPVRELALLRAGDLLCLGHLQIQLDAPPDPAAAIDDAEIDAGTAPEQGTDTAHAAGARVVLRGVSGAHFGRSHTLRDGLCVGGPGADVLLDDPAPAQSRLQLRLRGEGVVLEVQGEEPVRVNGVPCRGATLKPGDQIALDQHRFVLEAPGLVRVVRSLPAQGQESSATEPPPVVVDRATTIWWLIAVAAILAALITALLLHGPQAV